MKNRLKKNSDFILILSLSDTVTLMLLFFCLNNNSVLAQSAKWKPLTTTQIEQQLKAGKGADAKKSEDGKEKQHISAKLLVKLLKEYSSQDKRPYDTFYLLNAEIDDELELDEMTIPYRVRLENCTFNGDVKFSGSEFEKSLFLNGSTFHGTANFYNMKVGGDFQLEKTTFTDPERQVNLDSINVGGVLHLDDSIVAGPFTLSDSSMKELECTATEFNNYGTLYKETHEGKTTTHEVEVNANFYNIKVNSSATFTRACFGGLANFKDADIGKDLELTDVHFNNDSKDITFGSMKVRGDAVFNKTVFARGFDLSNVEVAGTLSFWGTEANKDKAAKTFSGMKVDTFVFDPANLAKPYSLQDAEYRLLNQIPTLDNEKLFNLIKKSDYSQSTYNNMAAYYKRVGLEEVADDVYVAGKLQEGSKLGCGKYLLNRLLYWTVGYGKYPWRALYWSLGFILFGYIVFFCEDNMMVLDEKHKARAKDEDSSLAPSVRNDGQTRRGTNRRSPPVDRKLNNKSWVKFVFVFLKTQMTKAFNLLRNILCSADEDGKDKTDFKYNPLWYSIALFLPIVDLEDVKIWTPKPECNWRRFYMRVHVIFGYLLIPIGLAAWTGLIK